MQKSANTSYLYTCYSKPIDTSCIWQDLLLISSQTPHSWDDGPYMITKSKTTKHK